MNTERNPGGLSVRALEPAEILSIYKDHITRDFPPNEVKPFSIINDAITRGEYRCYGTFDGGSIAAYAFFVTIREREKSIWLFDYLAVVPFRRDQGIGSAFLQALNREIMPEADAVLLEIDDPACADGEEHLHRLRREKFYHRNGLVDTGITACVNSANYKILEVTRHELHDRKTCQDYYLELYRHLLPSVLFDRTVRITN